MEWKRYRLLIVGVLALGLVAGVWALRANQDDDSGSEEGDGEAAASPLPTLTEEGIEEITIQRPEDDVATRLSHSEAGWRVSAPVEALANTPNVNSLVRELTSLEFVGRAAQNPEHHARLEVDEEHGIHITVRAAGETALDVWVGAVQSNNTMMRIEGQDEVLMVHGNIKHSFNRPLRDWRDRTIVEVSPTEVREMEFTNEHGHFHVHKAPEVVAVPPTPPPTPPEGETPPTPAPALVWQQVLEGDPAPAPIENFDAARVTTLVNAFGHLTAADFAGEDVTVASAGLGEGAATAVIHSGEGDARTTLTLRIGGEAESGQRYLQKNDDPIIYIVSGQIATRLMPETSTFQPPPPGAAEPPGGAPPPPGGAGGGPALSEEQMQQIMQQLQAQGGGH